MSDDTDKIRPSPPPASPKEVEVTVSPPPREPFEVLVTPSPPPTEPFDVPIYPDPPPWEPREVEVSPSPGPREAIDVQTTPSGPPVEPLEVATSPSPPPSEPRAVSVAPAGPPWEPVDVPVEPSPGPTSPSDVQTSPSPPPADPVEPQITPALPPGEPIDVPVGPSAPPWEPAAVDVEASPPPAEPFDVPIALSPPALDLSGSPGGTPTVDRIVAAVASFDARLGSFLSGLVAIEPFTGRGAAGALDPNALVRWFRDYVDSVGPAKVAQFTAEQAALYAMNPVVARVFNPGYLGAMLFPGSMGHVHTTLDTQAGLTADRVAELEDALLQAEVSFDPRRPGGGPEDAFGPSNTLADGPEFTVDELVEHAIDGVPHTFLRSESGGGGAGEVQRFDASRYFDSRPGGESRVHGRVRARAAAGFATFPEGLRQSAAINGIVRASISQWDVDGVVYSTTEDPSNVVDDDEARVPLCFTDLRHDPIHNGYRSVFFRPLNLTFGKALAPEFGETRGFGRVDPNVAYMGTNKTVTVSWEAHAFAPEDLRIIYNKMVALESMCYPTIGSDGLMRSGPVTRLRIGDAVGTSRGGLGGVIRSLSFDFADAIWELRRGMKVPRSYKASVDFLVLHDGPVGILDGQFGVLRVPVGERIAADGELSPKEERYLAESSAIPDAPQVMPGMYTRFGERRR